MNSAYNVYTNDCLMRVIHQQILMGDMYDVDDIIITAVLTTVPNRPFNKCKIFIVLCRGFLKIKFNMEFVLRRLLFIKTHYRDDDYRGILEYAGFYNFWWNHSSFTSFKLCYHNVIMQSAQRLLCAHAIWIARRYGFQLLRSQDRWLIWIGFTPSMDK